MTQEEMNKNIKEIKKIDKKIKELNIKNERLRTKYKGDTKYARIHKRLNERKITKKQSDIYEALQSVKEKTDQSILDSNDILNNENYFKTMMLQTVFEKFKKERNIDINSDSIKYIGTLVTNEYINEYNGIY